MSTEREIPRKSMVSGRGSVPAIPPHPATFPVYKSMHECSTCHALTPVTSILKHRDWHRGMAEASARVWTAVDDAEEAMDR